jgi:hypothetical protein
MNIPQNFGWLRPNDPRLRGNFGLYGGRLYNRRSVDPSAGLFLDRYNGAASTLLQNHTADTGQTYAKHTPSAQNVSLTGAGAAVRTVIDAGAWVNYDIVGLSYTLGDVFEMDLDWSPSFTLGNYVAAGLMFNASGTYGVSAFTTNLFVIEQGSSGTGNKRIVFLQWDNGSLSVLGNVDINSELLSGQVNTIRVWESPENTFNVTINGGPTHSQVFPVISKLADLMMLQTHVTGATGPAQYPGIDEIRRIL